MLNRKEMNENAEKFNSISSMYEELPSQDAKNIEGGKYPKWMRTMNKWTLLFEKVSRQVEN